MNVFAPGLRELARICQRQTDRCRLVLDRRRLARLETALGLLGWQQADYDADLQEHVQQLTNHEREQARLTNESAALGLEIHQIEERRGVAEREAAEAVAAAFEKEYPAAKTLEELETQLAAKRKEGREIEARLPELDRALANAEAEYRQLVSEEKASPQVEAQLHTWRRLIVAVPAEKAEWMGKGQRIGQQVATMEALRQAIREARGAFEKQDRAWAEEIAAHQRSKRRIERQIESVEKAKTDPYREIGRALADHNIAPLNQPEALTDVVAQRAIVASREEAMAASLAESAGEVRQEVWNAWMLLGLAIILLGMVGILAIGRH